MRTSLFFLFLCLAAFAADDLIKNPDFETPGQTPAQPAFYELAGRASYRFLGDRRNDYSSQGVALNAGPLVGTGEQSGSVSQTVTGIDTKAGRWFRFSIRGFPQEQFALESDGDLFLKVEFFGGSGGKTPFDGVTQSLAPLLEVQRRDLDVNGDYRRDGAAAWHTYQFDFKLPFPEIDQLKLSAGFRRSASKLDDGAAFWVDDFSLTRIPDPPATDGPPPKKIAPRPLGTVLPIAGRWYFDARNGETAPPKHFDLINVEQLFYKAGRWERPFAGNVSAKLRPGFKDIKGITVTEERDVPDSVTIEFTATHMILHCKNLPNHPTARFPSERGNPNSIQEQNYTYYLQLNPGINPTHESISLADHRPLHNGSIGVAVNGVVFYNPFDAGSEDATNIMDRCCGHPSPDNRYHYHKYPVCLKSPWADEGAEHSPLIGCDLDGFPVYGPYESGGLMAKDVKGVNALNEFNLHFDKERGWHYHATPGKFPYILGGFWGVEDPRNKDRQGPRPPGGGPGGRPDGPPPRDNGPRPPPPPPRGERQN